LPLLRLKTEVHLKLLTITVPSYNVEKTLAATLDSLCVEEILPKLDIIVVDDGSSDSTPEIAQKYAKAYPESVRVISQPNGGHGSAVNTGIKNAQGKYFKVVDGDDRLDKDGFIALVNCLEKTDADLVASNYKKVLPDGSDAGTMEFTGVEYNKIYSFDEIPVDGTIYFGIHSSTFKTEVLKASGIELQHHTFYVDAEYAVLPIPAVKTVLFLKDCVYLYTVGAAGQSIDMANFVSRYDDHLRVVKRVASFANECDCSDKHREYIYSAAAKLCFTQYMLAAFYDENLERGQVRARSFDTWLKGDPKLYNALAKSLYIRFLRATDFRFLPRSVKLKSAVRAVSRAFKRLTGRKKLTY